MKKSSREFAFVLFSNRNESSIRCLRSTKDTKGWLMEVRVSWKPIGASWVVSWQREAPRSGLLVVRFAGELFLSYSALSSLHLVVFFFFC